MTSHGTPATLQVALVALTTGLTILVQSAAVAQVQAGPPVPPLTAKSVANATYTHETTRVKVKDGRFTGKDADGFPVDLGIRTLAFGDLDADGDVDAIVEMNVSRGGSRREVSIEPVLNEKGKPIHKGGGYIIGDRAGIRTITVSGQTVTVEALVHGDDDALCCPTKNTTFAFVLQDGTLVAR